MDELFKRLKKLHKKHERAGWFTKADVLADAITTVSDAFDLYQADQSEENLTAYNQIVDYYNSNFNR